MYYNQPKMIKLLNISTQLDNTNLGQPITKQCFILFSLWCKKFVLAIKEITLQQNMVRSKCLNNFWSHIFSNFTGSEEFLYNMSQFTLFCYPHLHKWAKVSCTH